MVDVFEEVVKEVSHSESPLSPMERVIIKYIDSIEE